MKVSESVAGRWIVSYFDEEVECIKVCGPAADVPDWTAIETAVAGQAMVDDWIIAERFTSHVDEEGVETFSCERIVRVLTGNEDGVTKWEEMA